MKQLLPALWLEALNIELIFPQQAFVVGSSHQAGLMGTSNYKCLSFLTLICLVYIRSKRISENSVPYYNLLYPTYPTFPYPTLIVNLE